MYIYIYIERERDVYIDVYICIYIYIYIYVNSQLNNKHATTNNDKTGKSNRGGLNEKLRPRAAV